MIFSSFPSQLAYRSASLSLTDSRQALRVLALSLIVFITGCASAPSAPPVIEESSTPIERVPPPNTTEPEAPAPVVNPATQTLLAEAKSARTRGENASAITLLERAVRIEPRNPSVWTQLASAYLADGQIQRAEQHAQKAIALAGRTPLALREAWLVVADIRDAQGKFREATQIRRRYPRVRT